MVSHEAVLAALNSELMTAYVEAVIVPSKPERKTLDIIASSIFSNLLLSSRSDPYRFGSRGSLAAVSRFPPKVREIVPHVGWRSQCRVQPSMSRRASRIGGQLNAWQLCILKSVSRSA